MRVTLPDTYAGHSVGDLSDWSPGSVDVLITEGRRQLDTLNARFEGIRSRGQYLIGISVAATALSVAAAGWVVVHVGLFVLWCLGILLLGWTVLCAFAVFAGRAEMGTVDALLLSNESGESEADLARVLADGYVAAIRTSVDATNVRFTLLRDTIFFFALGLLLVAIAWALAAAMR